MTHPEPTDDDFRRLLDYDPTAISMSKREALLIREIDRLRQALSDNVAHVNGLIMQLCERTLGHDET